MKKEELFLRLAVKAMNWGEGAEFEMTELVNYDRELTKAIEKFYGVKYVSEEEWERAWNQEAYEEMTADEKGEYQDEFDESQIAAADAWVEILTVVQKDAVNYLKSLLEAKNV